MTTKTCKKCSEEKDITLFTKVKKNRDGYSGSCLVCDNKLKHDPEGSKRRTDKFRALNPQKNKEYYEKHKHRRKGKYAAYTKKYRADRPGWMAAQCAKRYAKKLAATPSWVDLDLIEEIYELAALRTKVTGIRWEVDHIEPLQGKDVCGLHVAENMQVIPKLTNISKGNRHSKHYTWSDHFV